MNPKLVFLIVSLLFQIIAYIPYFRDMFKRKTQPHTYTWLIWAITQGVAMAGVWYGEGGLGALNLLFGVVAVLTIFFFSLKYGTKNITKSDTVIFILALLAIVVWWQLKQPLISVIMVTLIDIFAFYPTVRKTYEEPWSETPFTWFFFSLSTLLALFALSKFSFMTSAYLITITAMDMILVAIIMYRRKIVPKA